MPKLLSEPVISACRRLRAEGFTIRSLAAKHGVSETTMSDAISGRVRERVRDYKAEHRRRKPRAGGKVCGANGVFLAAHQPREIRQVIDRDAIKRIIAERRGDISLDDLRAEIAP